MIWRRHQTTDY